MSDPVLSVASLGKAFFVFRHELYRVLRWFGVATPLAAEKWVLRNVTFSVQNGQALAIVGRNGAGKSTLLKLITGTMRPSEGKVQYRGAVSAILELGMGFNGDFTGRQNAYHSLGLMGRQLSEIEAVMAAIEDFSELGDYFDEPLRIYSSGMQMRLAFSVATAFRPDILIIDEALSVGDAYFQHKSFEKIKQFRQAGTTLILVSHDRMALLSLCDRAILLHEGEIALDGEPEAVLDYYNALLGQAEGEEISTEALADGRVRTVSGSKKVVIETVELVDANQRPVDNVNVGDRLVLRVVARANDDVEQLVLGYAIKDRYGQTMYGTNTFYSDQAADNVKAGEHITYEVGFEANLGVGTYSIALALVGGENHIGDNYEWRDLAMIFDVVNLDRQAFDGRAYIPSQIDVRRQTSVQ